MAIYNAWCDRVPVIVMGGNDLDAAHRPPGVPTFHSAQDINALVRDFTKWDDTPVSLQHFAQSFVRAYKISMTPPYGPVMISLDAGLQQEPIQRRNGEKLYIPKYTPTSPPQGDTGAVKEAARLLANAERPVIVVDRAARTANGVRLLVELAEALQARVVDMGGRMNFPKTHHLSAGAAGGQPTPTSSSAWSCPTSGRVVNGYIDNGEHGIGFNQTKIKPDTKLISINSVELSPSRTTRTSSASSRSTLSMAGGRGGDAAGADRGGEGGDPERPQGRDREARRGGEEGQGRGAASATCKPRRSPGTRARSAPRACRWRSGTQIKDHDWSLVAQSGNVSGWPQRLWPMEKYHHWLGGSGGYGVGYGAPASVGAALGQPRSRPLLGLDPGRRRPDVRAGRAVDRGASTKFRCCR